jgi:hypothetical protein
MNAPHDHHGAGPIHDMSAHARDTEQERLLELAFIQGFRAASDKRAFLELAGVPLEIREGGAVYSLMQVALNQSYEVGSAGPGFGGRDLVYHPLPGAMVRETHELRFIYLSIGGRAEFSLKRIRQR